MTKKVLSIMLAFMFVVGAATPTSAATLAELQAMIAQLQAQLVALQGGAQQHTFNQNLTIGSTGADVVALQNTLESKGFLTIPAGVSKGYFGALTQASLARYQASVGISPASGYFGPMTRAHFNAMVTPGPTNPNPTPSDTLEGGAGSVSDYELISSYNNEEVGEKEEDVVVAGLEIEADDSSDLRFTAVRLVFDQGTAPANADFEDYASEVSIWFDGEEVGRVDADEFNDDNNFTKTVTLDESAIVRADDTAEMLVAITGVRNLDSADAGDTWTVDFRQVRFEDAQGGLISEDPNVNTRTFSFDTFAATANVELKISAGDDAINDARVIDIDDNDDTDEVEILSFMVEADGTSDIEVRELPIVINTTGVNIADAISTVYLFIDGEEVASENATAAATTETITFEDIDYVIDAGDEVEFVVKVDIKSIADGIANGDTISAQISGTEVDLIDAEDETGEELEAADLTGSAIGEAHGLFDAGIMVDNVSVKTVNKTSSDTVGVDEQVTFEFQFDVTAFDTRVFVDNGCVEDNDGTYTNGTGVNYITTNPGNHSTVCTLTTKAKAGVNGYEVREGRTETFTLTVTATADTASGFVQVVPGMINWATTDIAGDQQYTFNLDDVKSQSIFINNR